MPTDSKTELRDQRDRLRSRLSNVSKKAKDKAEDFIEFGVAVGAAAGVGYWMGTDPENPQWAGVDKEIWIGGGLAILGLIGIGGPMVSKLARAAGTGILSAWAFNAARTRAIEADEDE